MIDVRQLLAGLTQAMGRADFPDETALAATVGLDLSHASITKTKSVISITGARLSRCGVEVDVACGIIPRRSIWDVKDEIFGADQRIQPSEPGAGVAVLFEIDGISCGFTASSPDGDVVGVFCEEPKAPSTG